MATLTDALAETLRAARTERGLSVAALAERSGVSRAMIGKVERGDAQPTAALLSRLATALGLTLSALIAHAEGGPRRLARRDEQPVWTDPESGYTRRAVSPSAGAGLELVEVDLPAGTEIAYPADAYRAMAHQIWVLDGELTFREGDVEHDLGPGDCLALGPPAPCAYVNRGTAACRYVVALARR